MIMEETIPTFILATGGMVMIIFYTYLKDTNENRNQK